MVPGAAAAVESAAANPSVSIGGDRVLESVLEDQILKNVAVIHSGKSNRLFRVDRVFEQYRCIDRNTVVPETVALDTDFADERICGRLGVEFLTGLCRPRLWCATAA